MQAINWGRLSARLIIFSLSVAFLSRLLQSTNPLLLTQTRSILAQTFPWTKPYLNINTDTKRTMATLPMQFSIRRSEERGHADHGWLKTFHTFSFANYQDMKHNSFGPLRVINEDRVAPRTGFGEHSHREFEIFSYVVSGQLEHKDSMGNTEVLNRGDIQMTSAGTGISHSEKAHGNVPVHFLQIWSIPNKSRLTPKYFTRHFSDEAKKDNWARIVAPVDAEGVFADAREGDGPAPVHSNLSMYATILSSKKTLEKTLEGPKGYLHVIQTTGYNPGKANGSAVKLVSASSGQVIQLSEGDGVYIQVGTPGDAFTIENVGDKSAEVILFDLN